MAKSSLKNTWLGTTTVKQDIADLGDQITNNWNQTVKTTGNQTIRGTKTFNDSIVVNTPTMAKTSNSSITIMEVTGQGEKNAYIDFIQPRAGFRNYSNIYLRIKNGNNTNFVNVLQIQTRDTGTGIYLAPENDKITFISPVKIANLQAPTANGDATNKEYVDRAIANVQPGTPQNVVLLTGDQTIAGNKTFTGNTALSRVTALGDATRGEAFFLPNKASGKSILYTGNSSTNDDKRFDIDLQNRSKLLNVPTPTANGDAVNKQYVDNKTNRTYIQMVSKTQNNISTRDENWNKPADFWADNMEYDVLILIQSENDKTQSFNYSFTKNGRSKLSN